MVWINRIVLSLTYYSYANKDYKYLEMQNKAVQHMTNRIC